MTASRLGLALQNQLALCDVRRLLSMSASETALATTFTEAFNMPTAATPFHETSRKDKSLQNEVLCVEW